MSAIQLLTAFSGESAARYADYFRFAEESRIDAVEIHAFGTNSTIARYSSREKPWHEVGNILRIKTADGFEGVSGVDSSHAGSFNDTRMRELQSVAVDLMALESLDPVEVATTLKRTRPDLSESARSSIDIALWDLAARKAELPLYQMLGAKRETMLPYASLPFYESLPEYVEAVNACAELGYTVFKFHVWGSIEEDLQLVALLQQTYAESDFKFMMDLECAYDFADALRLGQAMDQGQFVWLEGPVDDALLHQYAELRNQLAVQIIPAGYNLYSADFIKQGIATASWDAGRFDVTEVGGFSKALELLMVANAANLPIEIQSWGHSLSQAANLHLMLANRRTAYFEASMPKKAYEFGTRNGDLLAQGQVIAPKQPGLGIEIDWEQLATADFYSSCSA